MYLSRTVCSNQLAEAVCQSCPYEKVICKGHAKNLLEKTMTHSCTQLQNPSQENFCGTVSDLLKKRGNTTNN